MGCTIYRHIYNNVSLMPLFIQMALLKREQVTNLNYVLFNAVDIIPIYPWKTKGNLNCIKTLS